MPEWRRYAEDPRSTDELIRVALTELFPADREHASSRRALPLIAADKPALLALKFRPTPEVLGRASELCRSAVSDERRLGVIVLAELYELDDVAANQPAFVEESMRVLLELADSEQDIDVLLEVARALGYRRDPAGVRHLLRWRDHPEQPMRFFVAYSLSGCRTEENHEQVVGALVELTDDEDSAVRDYALFGLRNLEVDGPEVRDAMLRRVRDEDSSVAGEALVGLALLGDERGIEPLKAYLREAPTGRVASYGLDAAKAHADARLLPSLRAVKESRGELSGYQEAWRACAEDSTP